jgi:hypothetical protein
MYVNSLFIATWTLFKPNMPSGCIGGNGVNGIDV